MHDQQNVKKTVAFLQVTNVTSQPSLLKTDLSLTLKGNNVAYVTLNDTETRFFIVIKRWEEKLISRSIGSYFEKKFAMFIFLNPYTLAAKVTWG